MDKFIAIEVRPGAWNIYKYSHQNGDHSDEAIYTRYDDEGVKIFISQEAAENAVAKLNASNPD